MRNESRPLGERLIWPSAASGAEATKNIDCALMNSMATSSSVARILPILLPNLFRQFSSSYRDLLAGCEILQREGVGFDFILADDQDVLRARFGRGFE